MAEGSLQKFLFQGAESKIYLSTFYGKKCIIKERISKEYRHPDIDARLMNTRLIFEARSLVRARKAGICCPTLYFVDKLNRKLIMEYISGYTLKHLLSKVSEDPSMVNEEYGLPNSEVLGIALQKLGECLAKMHNINLCHNDITPCNVIISNYSPKIGFSVSLIDFGLSISSAMPEEKAVDLYVLERALQAIEKLDLVEAHHVSKAKLIDQKLQQVRLRGRKRT